jgi:tripartite-type tricarboxylate transporter receptor subunit TctC
MPIKYDPIKDFIPVAQFTLGYPVFVVNAGLGVKNMAELVAWAKARPGQLLCGTSGHGSGQHFSCELLARNAKIELRTVPYKGTGPMLLDTAAGQVHIAIGFLAEVDKQYIVPGKVIPFGVLSPKRIARFPDLPTMGEMGYVGFDMMSWTGLFVPAGTPALAVSRLNAAVRRAGEQADLRERLSSGFGMVVSTSTPEEAAAFVKAETQRWTSAIRTAGIEPE